MPLSFGEKVKILLKRRNMTITELATILGISQQLNCTYKGRVIMNDTGDEL